MENKMSLSELVETQKAAQQKLDDYKQAYMTLVNQSKKLEDEKVKALENITQMEREVTRMKVLADQLSQFKND